MFGHIPEWFVGLGARLGLFFVFWPSVQTKLAGPSLWGQKWQFWNLSDTTFLLFSFEYQLPVISAKSAAYLATFGEFSLSLAVLLGLVTRLSAFGLFLMVLVIQIFVYPDAWRIHLLWAVLMIYLMRHGAGVISLDRLFR